MSERPLTSSERQLLRQLAGVKRTAEEERVYQKLLQRT